MLMRPYTALWRYTYRDAFLHKTTPPLGVPFVAYCPVYERVDVTSRRDTPYNIQNTLQAAQNRARRSAPAATPTEV